MKKISPNVGVVTFPIYVSGITPLSNLINVLKPISGRIHLITGNAGYSFLKGEKQIFIYAINHKLGSNAFTRVIRYIWTQIKFIPILLKTRRNVDFFLFFLGGQDLFIPMLTVKLLGKKVLLAFAGSVVNIRRARKDLFFKPLRLLVKVNCNLSNNIILYSERLIKEYDLEGYRNKILIAPRHFLNFDKFKLEKQFSERDNLVGYIGRLYTERGALEFVNSIPKILNKKRDINFLIGGDGQLRNSIEEIIDKKQLTDKTTITGWIPHEELSRHLNNLKLIVLPSYTEGLPNIMLEAMACGTPVLATAVGGIPDIINNNQTGFLMKDNSPECIAENVVKILDNPNLEHIANEAKTFVEREFTYDAAVKRYKKVLNLAMQRRKHV
jgi:glycosyltransferase involved in cell wall biosynthesis